MISEKLLQEVLGEKYTQAPRLQLFVLPLLFLLLVLVVLTTFEIYPADIHGQAVVLSLMVVAVFFLKPQLIYTSPTDDNVSKIHITKLDAWLTVLLISITLLIILSHHFVDTIPVWVYGITLLILLESTRRVEGLALPILSIGFIIWYLLEGGTLAEFLSAEGVFSNEGVFGIAFNTVINVVYAFILLSVAYHTIQIHKTLNWLAFKITHERRSGPSSALYTILASVFYGAISGTARSNVEQTSKQTIPIMLAAGYSKEFTGGIAAAASGSGQIMPPIMGVVAFIIVQISQTQEVSYSYLDIMLAGLTPALLFIFSLIVTAFIIATRENLQPLRLELKQDILDQTQVPRELLTAQIFIMFISLLVLLSLLIMKLSLALTGLLTTASVVLMAYLLPATRAYITLQSLATFINKTGKDGISVGISCATVGLILFVFSQLGLRESLTEILQATPNFFVNILILLGLAMLPVILGMGLPIQAVYLITVFITAPILHEGFEITYLHAYMFVFYYAMLANIIPPVAPSLSAAAKLLNLKPSQLYGTTFRLSIVPFFLPFVWIAHPEIMVNTWNWDLPYLIKAIYMIFALLLASVSVSVGLFGVFRAPTQPSHRIPAWKRAILLAAATLIILPHTEWGFYFSMLGILTALLALLYADWQANDKGTLKPAMEVLFLVASPKNISKTVIFLFTSLVLVYTGFFVTSGLAFNLTERGVGDWLTKRPQLFMEVDSCEEIENVKHFLKHEKHSFEIVCTPTAKLSVSHVYPGDYTIHSGVTAIEFNAAYFSMFSDLKSMIASNYQEALLPSDGSCLRDFKERLLSADYDITTIKSQPLPANQYCYETNQDRSSLPVAYIGHILAKNLDTGPGSIIQIQDGIFPTTVQEDLHHGQRFRVAAMIALSDFVDINNLVIVPKNSLTDAGPEKQNQFNPSLQLHIKITGLTDLNALMSIQERLRKQVQSPVQSIVELPGWDIKLTFLNGTLLISVISGIICFIVLLGAVSQLVETNRKSIALMRLAGLRVDVIRMFLFLLTLILTLAPGIFAIPLSTFANETLSKIFVSVTPALTYEMTFTILGLGVLIALITTLILNNLHFSNDIPEELDLCQQ